VRYCFLFALVLLSLLTSSCEKHYLSVQQRWVDINYLASVQINTPDPRREHPQVGQMLIIDWRLPREVLRQNPTVLLDVIYWDYTTKTIRLPITHPLDYTTYELLDEEYEKTGGILTYKAQIVTESGTVIKESKHQLWVNLITVNSLE
jgi:hypothetical protein